MNPTPEYDANGERCDPNGGGWKESEIRNIMNPDDITASEDPSSWKYSEVNDSSKNAIWDMLSADMKESIVPVVKKTENVGGSNYENQSVSDTVDKLWILRMREVTDASADLNDIPMDNAKYGTRDYSVEWLNEEGSAYPFYVGKNLTAVRTWSTEGVLNPYLRYVNGVDGAELYARNSGECDPGHGTKIYSSENDIFFH